MSSIEIRKYEYQDTRAKNYFASPTYIDGITLDKILIEGFPIFNEEFANEFDSFEYKASDYDLVFSRLESTLTTTLSQSLETFLSTDLDNHCLVCKVTIGNKVFGGLIDVNSIVFIDNLDTDGYKIKITIFSMAKEFALATAGSPIPLVAGDIYINTFIRSTFATSISCLFAMVDGERLPEYANIFPDDLNWNARIGYEPVLIKELWSFLIDNDRTLDTSTWKLFEDLCTSFGIIYKFEFGGNVNSYFEIQLRLAFRDTGFSGDTISVNWLSRERGFISDLNANVIQCFKFQKEATIIGSGVVRVQVNEDHFYGTVFNKDDITTADGLIYSVGGGNGEEGLYSNGEGLTINKLNNPFPFDTVDKVNYIDMNYYFHTDYTASGGRIFHYILSDTVAGWNATLQAKYISFPRMFTKQGYIVQAEQGFLNSHNPRIIYHPEGIHNVWYQLIENTGGVCYPFLLQTFKKYVRGKISLMSGFDVNLFDKITVNSETYTIFKLSNLDLNNREVELFAIQN